MGEGSCRVGEGSCMVEVPFPQRAGSMGPDKKSSMSSGFHIGDDVKVDDVVKADVRKFCTHHWAPR